MQGKKTSFDSMTKRTNIFGASQFFCIVFMDKYGEEKFISTLCTIYNLPVVIIIRSQFSV